MDTHGLCVASRVEVSFREISVEEIKNVPKTVHQLWQSSIQPLSIQPLSSA